MRVLLTAMPRGDALRLIDQVSGFQVLVVGKPYDIGDANDPPTPPEMIGNTLVVEAPNHLQALGVVDLFVRDDKFDFADGSNTASASELHSVTGRINELTKKNSPHPQCPPKAASSSTTSWRCATTWARSKRSVT